MRAAAIKALASFSQAEDLPLLRELARDGPPDVCAAAIAGILWDFTYLCWANPLRENYLFYRFNPRSVSNEHSPSVVPGKRRNCLAARA